jgi:hypothetical protein
MEHDYHQRTSSRVHEVFVVVDTAPWHLFLVGDIALNWEEYIYIVTQMPTLA